MATQPLAGIRVLDFSTLLPGPLATLLLAEAGAEVIKIERPGGGEEMRSYTPKFGADSVNFALLNRGKRSIQIDLKDQEALARLKPLIAEADILVEQFRAGVMDRLGLGYEQVRAINPRIIYCSISGYGQQGARANVAAHDLNFIAQSGMLALAAGADGAPVLPAALTADIGGGTYPAVINILLALRSRDQSGAGCRLDIAMADNVYTYMYWAMGNGLAAGQWPVPGREYLTGASPRYNIYRTRDGKFLAAAPLEEKFWQNFCALIGLAPQFIDDSRDAEATRRAVSERIAAKDAAGWESVFAGKDVCCCIMRSVKDALQDPDFNARGVFAAQVERDGSAITALPVPIASQFRSADKVAGYPEPGEANDLLDT